MSTEEQYTIKEKYYTEATRYMENAKNYLKKAKINEDGFYQSKRYVKKACDKAYDGLLVALNGFFILNGIDKPAKKQQKSVEYYLNDITKIDKKMLPYLNTAHSILYYDDKTNCASVLDSVFDDIYKIIDKIKPTA